MKKVAFLAVSILILAVANQALALPYNTLYGHDYRTDSMLYTIDASTGRATSVVGYTGFDYVNDIAFIGTALFGITNTELITIDPNTGVGTSIGSTGTVMYGLTAASDGILYGGRYDLFTVDTSTGLATSIGSLGGGRSIAGDIAFDSDGTLYASINEPTYSTSWLATINPATGEATPIGDIGSQDVYGLSFKDEQLYGASCGGRLLIIDTSLGSGTLVGVEEVHHGGLSTSPSPVPEPATVLLLGTGLVGLVGFRKKFRK